jgi:hypothetical protein
MNINEHILASYIKADLEVANYISSIICNNLYHKGEDLIIKTLLLKKVTEFNYGDYVKLHISNISEKIFIDDLIDNGLYADNYIFAKVIQTYNLNSAIKIKCEIFLFKKIITQDIFVLELKKIDKHLISHFNGEYLINIIESRNKILGGY